MPLERPNLHLTKVNAITILVGMTDREQIAAWVQQALAQTPSVAATARALGVSRPIVFSWRAGTCCPTLDNAMRLAAYSGVPIPVLTDWRPAEDRKRATNA